MMALLCQESGRQKAGNGWESRKGSGEACGGERRRKAVCVSPGQGRERGEDRGANRQTSTVECFSVFNSRKKKDSVDNL